MLAQRPEFRALQEHYQQIVGLHMRELFAQDAERFQHFSIDAAGLLLDYSKNRMNQDTKARLVDLATASDLSLHIKQLFAGEHVNTTEQRAAAHMALRYPDGASFFVDGNNVVPAVQDVLAKMTVFADKIRCGQWLGATGMPITDVVNLGIGGSDLGPAMVTEALTAYHDTGVRCHFVANIDGDHIAETLRKLSPETTLFIVSTKSFRTQETILNAQTAKRWLVRSLGDDAVAQHFIAVTACAEKALAFGCLADNILPIWDWVGGRFSVWSAIGLIVMIMIGPSCFREFLAGAHAMDEHFRTANFEQNMPVMLALVSIWYINFFGSRCQAVIPYCQNLKRLPAYLQQAEMESNGKYLTHAGEPVDYQTAAVIWGTTGSNGQHAFHQLLHQGTQLIPVDFIVAMQSHHALHEHHASLVANCLSQSQALMLGKTFDEVTAGLQGSDAWQTLLAKHKTIPGNRPSNTITCDQLSPQRLGALLALYEHKIFSQGVIWGINSFDQWGVELGKQLAEPILADLTTKTATHQHDASTIGLIDYFKRQQ